MYYFSWRYIYYILKYVCTLPTRGTYKRMYKYMDVEGFHKHKDVNPPTPIQYISNSPCYM